MGWTRTPAVLFGSLAVLAASFGPITTYEADAPFFYLFLEAAVILTAAAVLLRKASSLFRAVLVNLVVISLCLAVAEAYFTGWLSSLLSGMTPAQRSLQGEYFTGGYFTGDEVRGYGPTRDTKSRARVVRGGEEVYDIVYTINRDGLRVTPHDVATSSPRDTAYENVVFFGCSVTVGEGVRDEEAMPWLFESLSQGRYRSYNFGFHGYGPHQMLRIIESGVLDSVVTDKPPRKAVYQALVEHVERSAGNYPAITWGPSAPQYVIDDNGGVAYKGPFCSPSRAGLLRSLNRSHVFRAVAPVTLGWQRTQRDIDLLVKIVGRSRDLFEERYRGEFTVLLWGPHSLSARYEAERRDYLHLLDRLRNEGIRVYEIDDVLPGRRASPEKYTLRGDEHPNASAHQLVARYLLAHL